MTIATTKPRINKYDNLRGLAILLVVIGHILVGSTTEALILKKIIYMLNLPLLYFVSGYFSKINENTVIKSFKQLIIPYIIFTVLIRIWSIYFLAVKPHNPIFIHPEFGLWFLLSLFIMKISLPIFDKLKYPITTAIMIELIIGLLEIHSGTLALTRTFGYLPIFLMGFYYKPYKAKLEKNHGKLMNDLNTNKYFICFVVATLIIFGFIILNSPQNMIKFKSNYSYHGLKVIYEIFERLIIILTQMASILIINKIMTNSKSFLTKLGINSMTIYLYHLFFVKPAEFAISYIPSQLVQIIISIIFGIILTFALSGDILNRYYSKFIDWSYGLLFKPINR